MMFNVTKLNKAIEVGTVIPMDQYNGNIGRWVEDQLEANGYTVNKGKGIDLVSLGIEVKTRMIDSTSGHTVGAMLPQDIIATPWEQSNVRDKVQRQYRVQYKKCIFTGDNKVRVAKIYDFTDNKIQSELKKSYEYGRRQLKKGNLFDYIRGENHWAYFEMQTNGYYQFRITPKFMNVMQNTAVHNRLNLFEFGD